MSNNHTAIATLHFGFYTLCYLQANYVQSEDG
jgi:hypothetical protein